MRIEEIRDLCTGCGACLSECPKKCITLSLDNEGFYYPTVDKKTCISCGKCERVCHCLNDSSDAPGERHSYWGFSLDEQVRRESTSGGAFSALAQKLLAQGGNVYGAAFDYNTLQLKHTSTDEVSLEQLLKSKYLESYMGNVIANIQHDLKNGRKVMFCGTPCQCAGVRQFFGLSPDLLLCDFICHGVPSSEIFKDYIQGKFGKNERLISLDFRPKDKGWSGKNLRLVTSKTTTTTPYSLDFFYKGFMTDNAFLRRSCYQCRYRSTHVSDITIADFWGYRELDPKLNDEKGLSLIVTHTEKGKAIVNSLENFELHEIDNRYSDYAFAPKDYSASLSVREQFYKQYQPGKLKKAALNSYMKDYYICWTKYIVKKILHRV